MPCPPSGDLPDPGIEPGSPASQADSLPTELPGKPQRELPPPPPMSLGAMLPSPLANVILQEAPLSTGVSRQEYWSRLPCPPSGIFQTQGITPRSLTFQADSLPSEPPGKPYVSQKEIKHLVLLSKNPLRVKTQVSEKYLNKHKANA